MPRAEHHHHGVADGGDGGDGEVPLGVEDGGAHGTHGVEQHLGDEEPQAGRWPAPAARRPRPGRPSRWSAGGPAPGRPGPRPGRPGPGPPAPSRAAPRPDPRPPAVRRTSGARRSSSSTKAGTSTADSAPAASRSKRTLETEFEAEKMLPRSVVPRTAAMTSTRPKPSSRETAVAAPMIRAARPTAAVPRSSRASFGDRAHAPTAAGTPSGGAGLGGRQLAAGAGALAVVAGPARPQLLDGQGHRHLAPQLVEVVDGGDHPGEGRVLPHAPHHGAAGLDRRGGPKDLGQGQPAAGGRPPPAGPGATPCRAAGGPGEPSIRSIRVFGRRPGVEPDRPAAEGVERHQPRFVQRHQRVDTRQRRGRRRDHPGAGGQPVAEGLQGATRRRSSTARPESPTAFTSLVRAPGSVAVSPSSIHSTPDTERAGGLEEVGGGLDVFGRHTPHGHDGSPATWLSRRPVTCGCDCAMNVSSPLIWSRSARFSARSASARFPPSRSGS